MLNTKQKISLMRDRELGILQWTKRISSPSKPSNISTNSSKGRESADNLGVMVPTAVESPKAIDAPSCEEGGGPTYVGVLLPAIDQKLCTPVIIAIIANYNCTQPCRRILSNCQ